MTFKIGDIVEARTPGSRTYSEAEVVSLNKGVYSLKFGDAVHPVPEKYVRAVIKTTKARGRSKSPARVQRSDKYSYNIRGRSATRATGGAEEKQVAKSPGRPAKNPKSKSPSRAAAVRGRTKSPGRPKSPGRLPVISSTVNEMTDDKPSFMEQMREADHVLSRHTGRVKNVGIVSPTSSSPQKAWSENVKKSATIVLHDILSSGSSRSGSRSSSRTNSELGAIDEARNLGRDTPLWLESEFGNLENAESLATDKQKIFPQVGLRRSTRGQSPPDVRTNVQSQRGLTPVNENFNAESDNEEFVPSTVQTVNKNKNKLLKVIEYCTVITLVVASVVMSLFLYYSCRSKTCGFRLPQVEYLRDLRTFFSLRATLLYTSLYCMVTLLSLLHILGSSVYGYPNKDGILKYYFNGFFTTITVIVSLFSMQWFEIPVIKHIQEQQFKLLIASIISAFLLSVFLFVRSIFMPVTALNIHGYTDSTISDFWIGREVNPRILSFDIKIIHYRMAIIGSIVLLITFGYEDFKSLLQSFINSKPADYNITLMTMIVLQILFDFDLMFHENQLIGTLEVQHEGVGLMILLKNALYPFLKVFSIKYIAQHNVRVPVLALPPIIAVFAVGYILFRYSNNVKHAVRENPSDSRFNHRDMYLTYSGRHLLVAKTWGFVRHPNYLGHMITLLSYIIPMFWVASTVHPFVPTIIGFVFFMHRAVRSDRYCEQKYKTSWSRYTGVVKSRLIPRVF